MKHVTNDAGIHIVHDYMKRPKKKAHCLKKILLGHSNQGYDSKRIKKHKFQI